MRVPVAPRPGGHPLPSVKPVTALGREGWAVLTPEAQGRPLPSVKPVAALGREGRAVLAHRACVCGHSLASPHLSSFRRKSQARGALGDSSGHERGPAVAGARQRAQAQLPRWPRPGSGRVHLRGARVQAGVSSVLRVLCVRPVGVAGRPFPLKPPGISALVRPPLLAFGFPEVQSSGPQRQVPRGCSSGRGGRWGRGLPWAPRL